MVLVVVGFVTLMLGVLDVGDEPLNFVYTSIGACILAGVFLIAGVLRSRPSRTGMAPAPATQGPADAGWTGPGSGGQSTEALPRDEEAPTTSTPAPPPAPPGGTGQEERPLDSWRPRTYDGSGGGGPSRAPATPGPSRRDPTARFGPDADDEDLDEDRDLVEEPETPDTLATGLADDEAAEVADEPAAPPPPPAAPRFPPKKTAKKAAKKGTKKAAKKAAKKSGAEKTGAEKAGTKKAGAKKAAKKSSTKKGTAKKSAAKKTATASAAASPESRRIGDVLSGVQGCGPAKHRKLAEHFGSYDGLARASVAEIAEVEGVSQALAQRIHERLQA